MLEVVTKSHPNKQEHRFTLDEVVILRVLEYDYYHTTKWDTHLSGRQSYEFVLEVYEALKMPHLEPKVIMLLGRLYDRIPLDEFHIQFPNPEVFDHPSFELFRVDLEGQTDGTSIIYDKTPHPASGAIQPRMGIISTYNSADVIPIFLKKSSPYGDRVVEEEVKAHLQRLHAKYKAR